MIKYCIHDIKEFAIAIVSFTRNLQIKFFYILETDDKINLYFL